jgi:hypothetical protein
MRVVVAIPAEARLCMAYVLNGFIGQEQQLKSATSRLERWRVVQVEQGLGLIPMIDCLEQEEVEASKLEDALQISTHFRYLSSELEALGRYLSNYTPVAYVEAEYFGGTGDQRALVWERGLVIFGPLVDDDDDERTVKSPRDRWPINQALRILGVQVGDALDEFDAVGLGRHRHPQEWANHAEPDRA